MSSDTGGDTLFPSLGGENMAEDERPVEGVVSWGRKLNKYCPDLNLIVCEYNRDFCTLCSITSKGMCVCGWRGDCKDQEQIVPGAL